MLTRSSLLRHSAKLELAKGTKERIEFGGGALKGHVSNHDLGRVARLLLLFRFFSIRVLGLVRIRRDFEQESFRGLSVPDFRVKFRRHKFFL